MSNHVHFMNNSKLYLAYTHSPCEQNLSQLFLLTRHVFKLELAFHVEEKDVFP